MKNRELLEKPFAPAQIKRRKGTDGDFVDYIEGAAVIQRLNDCFDADWTFDIGEHRVYDDEVVVVGRLTAVGITKSQFGKSQITRRKSDKAIVSLGDDLKAAATDSLKKCATLFGVGLHLYFDQSEGAPRAEANGGRAGNNNGGNGANGHGGGGQRGNGHASDHHSDNGGNHNGGGNGGDNGRLTAKQLSAIFALAKAREWSNKDVKDFTHEMFGKMPDFLTKKEASAVIQHLQGSGQ